MIFLFPKIKSNNCFENIPKTRGYPYFVVTRFFPWGHARTQLGFVVLTYPNLTSANIRNFDFSVAK